MTLTMKRLTIFCTIAISALFACTPLDDPENPGTPPEEEGSKENVTENFTPEIDYKENGYDGGKASDKDNDAVVSNDAIYWENLSIANKITVTYSGNTAKVETTAKDVKSYVTDADVAIDVTGLGASEIIAKGTSTNGQIKIYGDSAVKLTLDGLKLTSEKSAAINIQNKAVAYIHLPDKTENTICDAAKQTDEAYYPEGVAAGDEKRNGAIYSKGSIVFSGTGVLQLTGKKKHGISVKSSMTVRPGATIAINYAADNCVKAEGITILGGYIWAKTTGEAGKCLSSDADITVNGGVLKLYTTGNAIYDADENDTSSSAGMKADGNVTITGGEILCSSTGTGGKGINVDGALTIDDGTINVVTSGGKYVYNASLDLDSSPKGIKAEGNIVINGGLVNIQVTGRSDGSEGLESKSKITVNDGQVFVYAYDDAINVGGDYPVGLEINGGKLFAFADNNDGIDSNGKIWINDGFVIASGSAAPEEGFDCDRSENFIVKGGILIGTGGAAISTSSSSTQRNVVYNGISAQTDSLVVIVDPDGKTILKYKFPRTMSRLALFFSSPDIQSGKTYTVYTGGSISGNTENWNGWFKDGIYDLGKKVGTFTSNGINTTVGQGGGPGGGPGNGGPGNGGMGPGWWN